MCGLALARTSRPIQLQSPVEANECDLGVILDGNMIILVLVVGFLSKRVSVNHLTLSGNLAWDMTVLSGVSLGIRYA